MDPVRGIVLKLLSVCVFMAMATCIKAAADAAPAGEAVFFRSLFAIPPLLIWMAMRGELPAKLRTTNPMGHFWRGLVGVSSMGLGFLALGLLPLPEAVAIGYAAPLLATVFAAMFLGETVRLYRLAAVALGLAGVVMVLAPRLTVLDAEAATKLETVGAFAALMAAVFAALAQVFVRKLVLTEHTATIVFWFSVTSAALSLVTLPFGWVVPPLEATAMLIAAGVFGGIGQILLTSSYRHAETSVIAPFEYASMLLALGIGYVIFDEIPTWSMIGGAALVILAGIVIIWRERQLGIERRRAKGAVSPHG